MLREGLQFRLLDQHSAILGSFLRRPSSRDKGPFNEANAVFCAVDLLVSRYFFCLSLRNSFLVAILLKEVQGVRLTVEPQPSRGVHSAPHLWVVTDIGDCDFGKLFFLHIRPVSNLLGSLLLRILIINLRVRCTPQFFSLLFPAWLRRKGGIGVVDIWSADHQILSRALHTAQKIRVEIGRILLKHGFLNRWFLRSHSRRMDGRCTLPTFPYLYLLFLF